MPASRRSFRHRWDELAYCCAKVHVHLHVAPNRRAAKRFVTRVARLARQCLRGNPLAIVGAEARALQFEFDGRYGHAARWRETQARRIRRLCTLTVGSSRKVVAFLRAAGYRRQLVAAKFDALARTYAASAPREIAVRMRAARERAVAGFRTKRAR